MKHMDLFCASPASTAIVTHRSRPITRSRLSSADPKKLLSTAPCISELPFDPKLFSNYQKSRKSSAKSSEMRRKSSANIDDMVSPPGSSRYLLSDTKFLEIISESDNVKALVPNQKIREPRLSDAQGYEKSLSFKSSSSRSHSSQMSSNSSPSLKSSSTHSSQMSSNSSPSLKSSSTRSSQMSSNSSPSLKSSSTRSSTRHQVVELRVSIHCKGCEGKVKKHISKMEGVTSFSIDRELKKVTIIGDVTPLEVLASFSRVKNAQLWQSPTSSSSTTPKLGLITN